MSQSFSTTIIRPKDLLVISVDFVNVGFRPPQPGVPGQIMGAANALLAVHFQPQHIAEQAFYQASPGTHQTQAEVDAGQPALPPNDEIPTPQGTVESRLAGSSRLVFRVPAGVTIPYTVQDLLDALTRLPLSVPSVASFDPSTGCLPLDLVLRLSKIPAPPHISPPDALQTAIELPYRLMIAPDHYAQWTHASLPVTFNDWTELWHTRLGSQRPGGDPRVRAVWSPDYDPGIPQPHTYPPQPFRMSLDARDRNELVRLTSDYTIQNYWPAPVETEQLMLTTLGAWLKVQGLWEPPSLGPNQGSLTVQEWKHIATLARDHYVRVMYAGYLLPFGHRASLVKVTERKLHYQGEGDLRSVAAYLYQRMFIIVREPTRSYAGREVPFRTVTFKTLVTPDLASPGGGINGLAQDAFWPGVAVGGSTQDFEFHLEATDWENRIVEFTAPLIFVSKNVDEVDSNLQGIIDHYNITTGVTSLRRQRSFYGQSIGYAPSVQTNDTTFETASISFGVQKLPTGAGPHFTPTMAQAQIDIPAVKQLVGTPAASTVSWEPTYLSATGSLIGNAGDVFLKAGGTLLDFGSADKVGGLVAPKININGLSRALGPLGGPIDQIVAGKFNPKDIFPDDVKLFGGIKLSDILKDIEFAEAAYTNSKIPQLLSTRVGDLIRTHYTWNLSEAELVNTGLFIPQPGSTFKLEATIEKKLDGSAPQVEIGGEITHFQLALLPGNALVGLTVNSAKFAAGLGRKPDVSVDLGEMQFLGDLQFVNELTKYLPLDGFLDPPSVDLVSQPSPGVNVGFSMGIPTIGVGIMTMQNVSLAAGFFLPFITGSMNFHFAFCERQQPFILTVSLFGGGGFFSIDIGPDKVVMIEAALEFGASVALNLGVASGKASIMAGFYFQKAGSEFSLTGFFRASGDLSVLGLITVSLEFYLGLAYASKGAAAHGGTLWGQARLTVKIEILFFSTSVGVSMEREFAGSDPNFRELVSPASWAEYCDAFASF